MFCLEICSSLSFAFQSCWKQSYSTTCFHVFRNQPGQSEQTETGKGKVVTAGNLIQGSCLVSHGKELSFKLKYLWEEKKILKSTRELIFLRESGICFLHKHQGLHNDQSKCFRSEQWSFNVWAIIPELPQQLGEMLQGVL